MVPVETSISQLLAYRSEAGPGGFCRISFYRRFPGPWAGAKVGMPLLPAAKHRHRMQT